jgi:hypothetical protein
VVKLKEKKSKEVGNQPTTLGRYIEGFRNCIKTGGIRLVSSTRVEAARRGGGVSRLL